MTDVRDNLDRSGDAGFRFRERMGNGRIRESDRLGGLFEGWQTDHENWLFIAPHDDDIVVGAGLLLQSALLEDVTVSVLITTDGRMGYCEPTDREKIAEIRREETSMSLHTIGVEDVSWLDFPDGNLAAYLGRRPAHLSEPHVVEGFTGLENAYTYELRRRRPTRVFVPSESDLHPDHKIVYQETAISIFHAGGAIWPELGEPLVELPKLYELAVYCAFAGEPDYLIAGTADHLEKKLCAISAYRSQKQIGRLVELLRGAGPVEFLKRSDFSLYSPEIYRQLFEPYR